MITWSFGNLGPGKVCDNWQVLGNSGKLGLQIKSWSSPALQRHSHVLPPYAWLLLFSSHTTPGKDHHHLFMNTLSSLMMLWSGIFKKLMLKQAPFFSFCSKKQYLLIVTGMKVHKRIHQRGSTKGYINEGLQKGTSTKVHKRIHQRGSTKGYINGGPQKGTSTRVQKRAHQTTIITRLTV